jgi:hypothetical protein
MRCARRSIGVIAICKCRVRVHRIARFPPPIRDDPAAHSLRVILISCVRGHGHRPLITCSLRNHSPLCCRSSQMALRDVRLLPECVSRSLAIPAATWRRRLVCRTWVRGKRLSAVAIGAKGGCSRWVRSLCKGSLIRCASWWTPRIQSLRLAVGNAVWTDWLRHVLARRNRSPLRRILQRAIGISCAMHAVRAWWRVAVRLLAGSYGRRPRHVARHRARHGVCSFLGHGRWRCAHHGLRSP